MRQYTKAEIVAFDGGADLDRYSDDLEQALASDESIESIVRRFALERHTTKSGYKCTLVPRWGWCVEEDTREFYY